MCTKVAFFVVVLFPICVTLCFKMIKWMLWKGDRQLYARIEMSRLRFPPFRHGSSRNATNCIALITQPHLIQSRSLLTFVPTSIRRLVSEGTDVKLCTNLCKEFTSTTLVISASMALLRPQMQIESPE